jgi:peptide/nickel transport system substrate-binding protein
MGSDYFRVYGWVEPYSGRNLWAVDANIHMFNQGQGEVSRQSPGYETYDWERKIDNLLLSSAQVIDEAERKKVLGEFQQTVQEYLPMIHLVVPYSLGAVRDRIEGSNIHRSPAHYYGKSVVEY